VKIKQDFQILFANIVAKTYQLLSKTQPLTRSVVKVNKLHMQNVICMCLFLCQTGEVDADENRALANKCLISRDINARVIDASLSL